ncbi:MAG: ABC transporter permease [Candidatus Thermoplasmatota archaeon]|jgi:putative ABC transport system permease protein|nr:ABC transporter permease [Candidatus Thermoplasmatota archaeon]
MAMIGARNLIRHRGDSLIAVLGFMVGTSIICSSLAIGDTVDSFVVSLIHENYHMVDEVIYSVEPSGNYSVFSGDQAQEVSQRVWSMEDREDLLDGLSWELELTVSVVNPEEDLFEPLMTVRAFSPGTTSAFGALYSGGKELEAELGPDELVITRSAAEKLDVKAGSELLVGNGFDTIHLTVRSILDDKGRAIIFGGENLFASFDALWMLFQLSHTASGSEVGPGDWRGGSYNILYISNHGGPVEGGQLCKKVIPRVQDALKGYEHPPGSGRDLGIIRDKGSGVDSAKEGISTFTKLFVTIGAFSIVAGISLIINIFVMLSEERREEMGISRAIGTRRSHLRAAYLFEGALYSILSSLTGVLVGLAAAYLVLVFVEGLIGSFTGQTMDVLRYFTVRLGTLLVSFAAGFSITLGTTWFISNRISRLNIVSSVRGLPPPPVHTAPQLLVQRLKASCDSKGNSGLLCAFSSVLGVMVDRLVLWGAILITAGIGMVSWGLVSDSLWQAQVGLSLALVGFGLIIRHWLPDRAVFSMVSLVIMFQWALTPPFFRGLGSDLEMFLISGFVLVTSGVVLAVWNTETLVQAVTGLFRALGMSAAPVRIAVSYPLKKRFRTGSTMFMFALIIFTVTGTSVVAYLFNLNIEDLERSVGGGYEVVGISLRDIPDLKGSVRATWGEGNLTRITWERTTSLAIGFIKLNLTSDRWSYTERSHLVCAVTPEFRRYNTYGFNDVDWDLLRSRGIDGRSDEDVWRAVDQPDLVIVDSSLGENSFGPPGLGLGAGTQITIILQNGTRLVRTIAAITDQFAIRAIFTNETTARNDYNVSLKRVHMLDVARGEDANAVSDGLRRALKEFGLYTIVIKDVVEEILRFQNGFFNLFNAYLSLGLVIGIVGLGIVTLRAVYERRHEIGMMRAVGFKRRAVMAVFLGEASYVAGTGVIVGAVMGTALAYMIWKDQLQADLPLFGIPWATVVMISIGALAFSLLSTLPPSRLASRIAPAEALRYE